MKACGTMCFLAFLHQQNHPAVKYWNHIEVSCRNMDAQHTGDVM